MKYIDQLENIAQLMVKKGKGILAADESTATIGKRLDLVNVQSSFEKRLEYREMLFTTNNLDTHISGVILYDETLKQTLSNGFLVPEYLKSKEIFRMFYCY